MFTIKYIFLFFFAPRSRKFLEYKLFKMLNKARKDYNLYPLFFQKDLRVVARKHSVDMARKSYFAHEALDGSSPKDRFERSGVSESIAGENLAKVRGFRHPVRASHDGLMNSPGHKANILSTSYNCVGIGLAISRDKTYYFTQNFSFRYLVLKDYRETLWFSKKFILKGKVLNEDVRQVMVILKSDFYEINERFVYDLTSLKEKFRFKLNFSEYTTYEILVFVLLRDELNYKLSNSFEVKRGVF